MNEESICSRSHAKVHKTMEETLETIDSLLAKHEQMYKTYDMSCCPQNCFLIVTFLELLQFRIDFGIPRILNGRQITKLCLNFVVLMLLCHVVKTFEQVEDFLNLFWLYSKDRRCNLKFDSWKVKIVVFANCSLGMSSNRGFSSYMCFKKIKGFENQFGGSH